jgi:hypothetical protein
MLDGSVLRTKARRAAVQLFTAGELLKDFADHRCIGVEFRNMASNILLGRVA